MQTGMRRNSSQALHGKDFALQFMLAGRRHVRSHCGLCCRRKLPVPKCHQRQVRLAAISVPSPSCQKWCPFLQLSASSFVSETQRVNINYRHTTTQWNCTTQKSSMTDMLLLKGVALHKGVKLIRYTTTPWIYTNSFPYTLLLNGFTLHKRVHFIKHRQWIYTKGFPLITNITMQQIYTFTQKCFD